MTIIGFSFKKILAERGVGPTGGKINIANNVSVKHVEEVSIPLGKDKQRVLKFTYEFITKYEPAIGSINIEGEIIYLTSTEMLEKALKDWKKDKKIEKDILAPLLNTILTKCSIKGLFISQDLNLPSPVQLPKVTVK